jgi:putative ABC transport system substrate-binding protein
MARGGACPRQGAYAPGRRLYEPTRRRPQSSVRSAAFLQALAEKGWTVGRNLQIDFRWATEDTDRLRKDANELVALAPEVVLAAATRTLNSLQQATHTIPIVFVQAIDPVGTGAVESLARPGGNITGLASLNMV